MDYTDYENTMDYTDYEDTINNTDGIYTSFSEELPYEIKTEDADLKMEDAVEIVPLMLLATTKKKTKKNKKKNKKTKRKTIYKKRGSKNKQKTSR
jgi:hypothetical protein